MASQKSHIRHSSCGIVLNKLYFVLYNPKRKGGETTFCQEWMWCNKCRHPVKINQSDPLTEEITN